MPGFQYIGRMCDQAMVSRSGSDEKPGRRRKVRRVERRGCREKRRGLEDCRFQRVFLQGALGQTGTGKYRALNNIVKHKE